jgi:ABC-2 type transport system permease protein
MFKRIASLIRKEFIQIRRDKRTLVMMVAIPLIWIVLFGYAATFDVPNIKVVVAAPEGSITAPQVIAALQGSDRFKVVETGPFTDAELESAIAEHRASVAIRPPETSAAGLFIVDGSDLFTAQAAVQQLQSIIRGLAQQTGSPTVIDPKILYNPDLRSVNYMIPGLVGIVMVFIATMLTAIAIVRERERGTLEQLLVTPANPFEIMLGKIVPYLLVAFFDFVLVIVCGVYIFNVPMADTACGHGIRLSVRVSGLGAVDLHCVAHAAAGHADGGVRSGASDTALGLYLPARGHTLGSAVDSVYSAADLLLAYLARHLYARRGS